MSGSISETLQVGEVNLIPAIFLAIIILIIVSRSIRIIREYERVVVFRLGRLIIQPDGSPYAKGPGIVFVIPFIDRIRVIDLRLLTFDIPKQRIITKDNVTVDVDAVVYFRVADAVKAVVKVEDYITASSLLSQTTLRDVIGQTEFDDLLTKRDELNKRIQHILDEATDVWGIKVTAVAIKDVSIPENMQRAIAKQAEAERERRSRIIIADGEYQAAQKMQEAARYYAENPAALRLRELQTWTEIAREKNMIIVTEGSVSGLGTLIGIAKDTHKTSSG
jgi:regulator of protease activity HflC (stomatin/prohibitin superfamily)